MLSLLPKKIQILLSEGDLLPEELEEELGVNLEDESEIPPLREAPKGWPKDWKFKCSTDLL